jgi:hypothetical protein
MNLDPSKGNTDFRIFTCHHCGYEHKPVASGKINPTHGYELRCADCGKFLGWSGFNFTMNDTLDVTGVVIAQNFTGDAITTTTQTSSAAIWVLTAGTTYNLRRNSSSQRYKTNITDVDQVVIDAAKRIKPRHYESTIEDEAGATRLGFIAEEVEAAGLTHAVGYDQDGRPESLDSIALIAALFARIEDLEKRVEALAPAPSVRYDTGVPKSSITD